MGRDIEACSAGEPGQVGFGSFEWDLLYAYGIEPEGFEYFGERLVALLA